MTAAAALFAYFGRWNEQRALRSAHQLLLLAGPPLSDSCATPRRLFDLAVLIYLLRTANFCYLLLPFCSAAAAAPASAHPCRGFLLAGDAAATFWPRAPAGLLLCLEILLALQPRVLLYVGAPLMNDA